ncbi:50S ribosomal protein L18 [Legionella oakridgensis]|uniref:Large ribosomal subunit protein uL18 n=2 Tax=Legionella oakridgensis TaxID=29423 RepID=W0B7Z3_9GAMM|nr:50S ribosomal protein L18 [Legionella oakridgensis]AHE65985.1 ribosomal protein L18, bacterial type [Legionella oakridgensis ATCC 33761 = DSM 21215]ETO94219.1 LSU ribosomal protein L18P [Legionella oakridgensis RV-2-2007]KTD43602.1 50S ribosomal protein L18 [Legionella oakridgensis]STY15913.1 50S ribosomal protein L18 [Legionella longbeachae]
MNKYAARKRRASKAKAIIRNSDRPRLVVYRSASHIYSQIVRPSEHGDEVLVSSSTLDKELKANLTGNKCEQAMQVGKLLAKRAKEKEVVQVAFDRAGYKYHGRVKALAEAAREAGLDF